MTLDQALGHWKLDKSLSVLVLSRLGFVVAHWLYELLDQLVATGAKHDHAYDYQLAGAQANVPVSGQGMAQSQGGVSE